MLAIAGLGASIAIKSVVNPLRQSLRFNSKPTEENPRADSVPSAGQHATAPPRIIAQNKDSLRGIRQGSLVCFFNTYDKVIVVQPYGNAKSWQLTASSGSTSNLQSSQGCVSLPFQAVDSLFVVECTDHVYFKFQSVGAGGLYLQAVANSTAGHTVAPLQNNGGAGIWKVDRHGFVNAAHRHKRLGYTVVEVRAITVDALHEAERLHEERHKLLMAQANASQARAAAVVRKDAEKALAAAQKRHVEEEERLQQRLQQLKVACMDFEKHRVDRDQHIQLLEEQLRAVNANSQDAAKELAATHDQLAQLQQDYLSQQETHAAEKRRMTEDTHLKLAALRSCKDTELNVTQDRGHAALEQELIEKEDTIADLTEQNQRLEYALKNIERQLQVVTNEGPPLDRASLDQFSTAELREAVDWHYRLSQTSHDVSASFTGSLRASVQLARLLDYDDHKLERESTDGARFLPRPERSSLGGGLPDISVAHSSFRDSDGSSKAWFRNQDGGGTYSLAGYGPPADMSLLSLTKQPTSGTSSSSSPFAAGRPGSAASPAPVGHAPPSLLALKERLKQLEQTGRTPPKSTSSSGVGGGGQLGGSPSRSALRDSGHSSLGAPSSRPRGASQQARQGSWDCGPQKGQRGGGRDVDGTPSMSQGSLRPSPLVQSGDDTPSHRYLYSDQSGDECDSLGGCDEGLEELEAWLKSPHKSTSTAAALSPEAGYKRGALEEFEGDDGEGPRDGRMRRSGACARSGGSALTPVREEEEQGSSTRKNRAGRQSQVRAQQVTAS